MSSSAAWNKTVADAKKILGNTAKIPEQRVQLAIKFALESNKVWDGFNALREAMKKKILEQQNADSKVMNTLHQAWDEIQESDFGLDDSKPDDKKKIAQATAVFNKFFTDTKKTWDENDKNIDELDKHLMNIAKYKRTS